MESEGAAKNHRCGMPFLDDCSNNNISSLAALGVRLDNTPSSAWTSSQRPHFCHTPWPQVMSQQSDTAQSYQPNSYPNYSAPSMAAPFIYPPPEGQGQARSPSGLNMAHPNISLPPIRSIDGITQPQHQQSQPGGQAPPMGSAMPPNMGQYYGQGQYPPPSSDPNAPVRYPIPPDGRQMSGGRHKKEIKRRTKTGCLTCRKRRIKVCSQHSENSQRTQRNCDSKFLLRCRCSCCLRLIFTEFLRVVATVSSERPWAASLVLTIPLKELDSSIYIQHHDST